MRLGSLKRNGFFDLCISFRQKTLDLTNFVDDQTVSLKDHATDFASCRLKLLLKTFQRAMECFLDVFLDLSGGSFQFLF